MAKQSISFVDKISGRPANVPTRHPVENTVPGATTAEQPATAQNSATGQVNMKSTKKTPMNG